MFYHAADLEDFLGVRMDLLVDFFEALHLRLHPAESFQLQKHLLLDGINVMCVTVPGLCRPLPLLRWLR